jgi:hypothetical protein
MLYGKGAARCRDGSQPEKLFDIGVAGLTLMVPFLAAYIGYSISDRAALALRHWRVGRQQLWRRFLRRADRRDDRRPGGLLPEKIPVHKVLRS